MFPALHEQPDELVRSMWNAGFDATRGASSLYVVDPPADRPALEPAEARAAFEHLLYLPVYAGLSRQHIERLATTIR